MFFFVTPDTQRPNGGVKQIYRHVQLLTDAGVPARVLHTKPNQRCRWFQHQAPSAHVGLIRGFLTKSTPSRWRVDPALRLTLGDVVYLESEGDKDTAHVLEETDVFVIPEYDGDRLEGALKDFSIVVFNQNAHNTFRHYPLERRTSASVYSRPNVLGAVTVSEHNREYLSFAFPGLKVVQVTNGVDNEIFRVGERKERRIAFMPRKLKEDLAETINILSERGSLDNWTLAPIDKMSESEVASELRRASVYLSTCRREGLGLPPIEAGMSGCLVVGYDGTAAAEYLDPDYCFPVAQGDTLSFAKVLEKTLLWCESNESGAQEMGKRFAAILSARYSLENQKRSALKAWSELCGSVEWFQLREH